MSKTERFTLEEKKQIAAEYADRTNKVIDIRTSYGINSKTLAEIITQMGGELRLPNAHHPNKTKGNIKVCKKCHKKIDLVGARFCPFCGEDIRDEKELLIEKAQGIFPLLVHLPSNEAETTRQTISDIIKFISGK